MRCFTYFLTTICSYRCSAETQTHWFWGVMCVCACCRVSKDSYWEAAFSWMIYWACYISNECNWESVDSSGCCVMQFHFNLLPSVQFKYDSAPLGEQKVRTRRETQILKNRGRKRLDKIHFRYTLKWPLLFPIHYITWDTINTKEPIAVALLCPLFCLPQHWLNQTLILSTAGCMFCWWEAFARVCCLFGLPAHVWWIRSHY